MGQCEICFRSSNCACIAQKRKLLKAATHKKKAIHAKGIRLQAELIERKQKQKEA